MVSDSQTNPCRIEDRMPPITEWRLKEQSPLLLLRFALETSSQAQHVFSC